METQLTVFENHEVMILFPGDVNFKFDGDFIIRAKDVADVLEYQGEGATNKVLKFCKEKHIYNVKNSDIPNRNVRKLNNAGEKFISNLSLNRVLGKSEQPKAEPFQDWLYEDLVPNVAKRGVYLTTEAIEKTMMNPDFIIQMATEIKNERELRLVAENKLLEVAPKIAYIDTILKSKGTVTTTQVAKDYGLSAKELNEILHEEGIQYKVNEQWVLYRKYDGLGYTQSHAFDFVHKDGTPDVKMITRWTQRGRLFIHEILQRLGIKANIDKEYDDAK